MKGESGFAGQVLQQESDKADLGELIGPIHITHAVGTENNARVKQE